MGKYDKIYKENKENIVGYRAAMVRYAENHNVSSTAEYFETTRKTVGKWLNRYDGTLESLEDHSKRPHNIQTVVKAESLEKIRKVCETQKSANKKIAGTYLIEDLKLPYSLPTVNKYIKLLGFKQVNLSHKKRKRNLRELKRIMKSFEKIQVDIKYLDDIPEFYREYYTLKIPRYQITARCVKSGALFIGYAEEKTNLNTAVFIYMLLSHLHDNGIDIAKITIQTDNGTEFRNFKSNKSTMFLDVLGFFGLKYYHIPAGAKTWQSDVETSHRLIEDEFYAYRIFDTRSDFFRQAHTYQKHFNLNRKNCYKENQTPADIITDDLINDMICLNNTHEIYVDDLLDFKPMIMDNFVLEFLKDFKEKLKRKSG